MIHVNTYVRSRCHKKKEIHILFAGCEKVYYTQNVIALNNNFQEKMHAYKYKIILLYK